MASQTEEKHVIDLPEIRLKGPLTSTPLEIAEKWIKLFNIALETRGFTSIKALLYEDCWWRDFLALTWDFRTVHEHSNVITFLEENLTRSKLANLKIRQHGAFPPSLQHPHENLDWIQAMFDFKTKAGTGTGVVRLVQDADKEWKAFAVSTQLQELNGYGDKSGVDRPMGGSNAIDAETGNWFEKREKEVEFEDSSPAVLLIGAGQSGLNLAARLRQLGLSCLVIDKNPRIGDNWRNRYRSLVTHDPVHFTHMPYLPFPKTWPMFTPKDKLADWFEAYASLMELNVWTSITIISAKYDDECKFWTVDLQSEQRGRRVLFPKHIVMCTGHAGEPRIPTFPDQDSFQGQVYHGSQHRDASESSEVKGKKVIVVGTGNSGHDIAQNFYENGADVTILQRSGTYVLTAKTGLFMLHTGMYEEGGPPAEDADIIGHSLPIPLQFAFSADLTQRISKAEKATQVGLKKAGFELDFAPGGSGIHRKYLTRGGGYYIDVGCSQLIIDGKIKVVNSPGGIRGFSESSLILGDGREIDADVVVLATGYDNMRTSVRKILGDEVADRCHNVWDLDDEGEVNAMWRNSGHPGFWYMGGSLALARIYSKFLALQIKATEEGLLGAEQSG